MTSADLTEQPAWPTLRARLLLLAAHDVDPALMLRIVAARAPLTDAHDPAAVIAWRLDDPDPHHDPVRHEAGPSPQPLPWLPSIPLTLAAHPTWGPYLTRRADLVRDLTTQVHATDSNDSTVSTGSSTNIPTWGLSSRIPRSTARWRTRSAPRLTAPPTGRRLREQ